MDGVEIRAMKGVAEDMLQAARNFDGAVDRLGNIMQELSGDLAALMSHLEKLEK